MAYLLVLFAATTEDEGADDLNSATSVFWWAPTLGGRPGREAPPLRRRAAILPCMVPYDACMHAVCRLVQTGLLTKFHMECIPCRRCRGWLTEHAPKGAIVLPSSPKWEGWTTICCSGKALGFIP